MDHDHSHEPSFRVRQHALERWTLGQIVRAGTATFIPIDVRNLPVMGLTVEPTSPVLGIQAVALDLLLTGDALIEGSADGPCAGRRGHRDSSRGSASSVIGSMPNTSHSTRTPRAVASL